MRETRQWTIGSDVQAILPVVEIVQSLCTSAGFSSRQCQLNIPVSLTEAMANAIIRGNNGLPDAVVRVTVVLDNDGIMIEVTDEGSGFNADQVAYSPNDADWLHREDGRGLFLMRSLMDHVESQCVDRGGHTLKLKLRKS